MNVTHFFDRVKKKTLCNIDITKLPVWSFHTKKPTCKTCYVMKGKSK